MAKLNNLQKLRRENKISQAKLGEIFGVAESTISLYESKKRNIPNELLGRIADYFGVSTDYILDLTDDPGKKEIPEKYTEALALLKNPGDKEILMKYIELDEAGKNIIDTLMDSLLKQQEQSKE